MNKLTIKVKKVGDKELMCLWVNETAKLKSWTPLNTALSFLNFPRKRTASDFSQKREGLIE